MSVFDDIMSVSESDWEDSDKGEMSENGDIEERSIHSDMEDISEHIVVQRVRLKPKLAWIKVGGRCGGPEKKHVGARKESFDVLIPSDSEDDADLEIPGLKPSEVFMGNDVKIVDQNELGSTLMQESLPASSIITLNVLTMSDTEEEDTDVEDFQKTSYMIGRMEGELLVTGGKYGDRNNNLGGGRMEMNWEGWESELDESGVEDSDLEISGIEKLDVSTDRDNNEISPVPRSSTDSPPDLLSVKEKPRTEAGSPISHRTREHVSQVVTENAVANVSNTQQEHMKSPFPTHTTRKYEAGLIEFKRKENLRKIDKLPITEGIVRNHAPWKQDKEPYAECNSDWNVVVTERNIDDFIDLNFAEKDLFKLWNEHMNSLFGVAYIHMSSVVEKFVATYGNLILEKNLYRNLVAHLNMLAKQKVIGTESMVKGIMQLQQMMKSNKKIKSVPSLGSSMQENQNRK